jgi:hypothetical protein
MAALVWTLCEWVAVVLAAAWLSCSTIIFAAVVVCEGWSLFKSTVEQDRQRLWLNVCNDLFHLVLILMMDTATFWEMRDAPLPLIIVGCLTGIPVVIFLYWVAGD